MTETNPFPKFSRAWFAWNGKKGGRAGRGASKRRERQHYVDAGTASAEIRHGKTTPAETDPYSGT